MAGDPDTAEEGGFTPLDRLVMELFRTISPNTGSLSNIASTLQGVTGTDFVSHPHPETSRDPRHWPDPDAFNPDRYRTGQIAAGVDEEHCAALGLARCPFSPAPFAVEDPRAVERLRHRLRPDRGRGPAGRRRRRIRPLSASATAAAPASC